MKSTMTHDEIRTAFSEIYNSFYLRNRCAEDRKRTDEEWEKIIKEADVLVKKYDSCLTRNIVSAFIEEFENEEKKKSKGDC